MKHIMNISLALLATAMLTVGAASPSNAAAPAPAAVPVPTTAGCLLVSNLFAKHATEQKDRALGERLLYFFMGRIDDRMSAEQLKSALRQQRPAINDTNATGLMNACVHEMQLEAQALEAASQQLQQGK